MDIGREPLARMPFDRAPQGTPMPLVVPSDFVGKNTVTADTDASFVKPQSNTVGFTGSSGAVKSPIWGGEWSLSENVSRLTFSFTVLKELWRGDVYVEAGTALVLSTRVYTQTELDRLNQEYYKAHKELWLWFTGV